MIGHNAVLDLRRKRLMPAAVYVLVRDHTPKYWAWESPEKSMLNGGFPCIDILPTDDPDTLDLRCLFGLLVHLNGYEHLRLLAVLDRMTEFNPARIVAPRLADPVGIMTWTPAEGFSETLLE